MFFLVLVIVLRDKFQSFVLVALALKVRSTLLNILFVKFQHLIWQSYLEVLRPDLSVLSADVVVSVPVVVVAQIRCQTLEVLVAKLLPSLARLQSVAPVRPTNAVESQSTVPWFLAAVLLCVSVESLVP